MTNENKNSLDDLAGLAGVTMIVSGTLGIKQMTINYHKEHREQTNSQETQAFTTQPSEGPYSHIVADYLGWPTFFVSSAIFFGAVLAHYIKK